MTVDTIMVLVLVFILGTLLIGVGSRLYFAAKEDYVDRLIEKRKGNSYGDW